MLLHSAFSHALCDASTLAPTANGAANDSSYHECGSTELSSAYPLRIARGLPLAFFAIHELICSAASRERVSPLTRKSAARCQGMRHAFHEYLPSFRLS